MKRLLLVVGVFCFALPLSLRLAAQTTQILLRPTYIDISATASQSAVLIRLSDYPTDEVRYRLFSGSYQYYCWDRETQAFVATNSYSSGPLAVGTPSVSATFWVPFQRGSNNSTSATYRDRLGPLYSVNYRDVPLPSAIAIGEAFTISGTLLPGTDLPLTNKYIVLAFNQSELLSASHSEIATGNFAVACPVGKAADKIEIRTIGNETAAVATGDWAASCSLGNIQLSLASGVISDRGSTAQGSDHAFRVFPVPAKNRIYIEAGFLFNEVKILTLAGRRVLESGFQETQQAEVNVEGLPAGVYFVLIYSNNRFHTCTIVKN